MRLPAPGLGPWILAFAVLLLDAVVSGWRPAHLLHRRPGVETSLEQVRARAEGARSFALAVGDSRAAMLVGLDGDWYRGCGLDVDRAGALSAGYLEIRQVVPYTLPIRDLRARRVLVQLDLLVPPARDDAPVEERGSIPRVGDHFDRFETGTLPMGLEWLRRLREDGAVVTVFEVPLHPEVRARFAADWPVRREAVRAALRAEGFRVDEVEGDWPASSFRDASHLDLAGEARFRDWLCGKLR